MSDLDFQLRPGSSGITPVLPNGVHLCDPAASGMQGVEQVSVTPGDRQAHFTPEGEVPENSRPPTPAELGQVELLYGTDHDICVGAPENGAGWPAEASEPYPGPVYVYTGYERNRHPLNNRVCTDNQMLNPNTVQPLDFTFQSDALALSFLASGNLGRGQYCVDPATREGPTRRLRINAPWTEIRRALMSLTGFERRQVLVDADVSEAPNPSPFFTPDRLSELYISAAELIEPQLEQEARLQRDETLKEENRDFMSFNRILMIVLAGAMLLSSYLAASQKGWTRPLDHYIDKGINWLWDILRLNPKVDFVTDLTREAKEGKLRPAIGRERPGEDIERFRENFHKGKGRVPTVIAEAGEGKSHFMDGIVYEVFHDRDGHHYTDSQYNPGNRSIPEFDPARTRAYRLSLSALSGSEESKYVGQLERRWREFTEQVEKDLRAGHQVLVTIDEIHRIRGIGKTTEGGANDLGNTIKDWVTSVVEREPNLRVIGATTVAEYRQYIHDFVDYENTQMGDPALGRRLPPWRLSKLEGERLARVINYVADREEAERHVTIGREARGRALQLSVHPRIKTANPDAVLTIIDDALARVSLRRANGETIPEVTPQIMEEVFLENAEKYGLNREAAEAWINGDYSAADRPAEGALRSKDGSDRPERSPRRDDAARPDRVPPDREVQRAEAYRTVVREIEGRHGVRISDQTVRQAIDWVDRGTPEADSLVRVLLERAASRAGGNGHVVQVDAFESVYEAWMQADSLFTAHYGEHWTAIDPETRAPDLWRFSDALAAEETGGGASLDAPARGAFFDSWAALNFSDGGGVAQVRPADPGPVAPVGSGDGHGASGVPGSNGGGNGASVRTIFDGLDTTAELPWERLRDSGLLLDPEFEADVRTVGDLIERVGTRRAGRVFRQVEQASGSLTGEPLHRAFISTLLVEQAETGRDGMDGTRRSDLIATVSRRLERGGNGREAARGRSGGEAASEPARGRGRRSARPRVAP